MMNKLDAQYQGLLGEILEGNPKGDRTGTGTMSTFAKTIKHDMREGFPLLTTKKMYFKGIVTELLWFLRGETNIRNLVMQGCHIWDGDAYKNYCKYTSANSSEWNEWMKDNGDGTLSMYTKEEFVKKIEEDADFANRWGDLGPIYGKQWRSWDNPSGVVFSLDNAHSGGFAVSNMPIDQIDNLIKTLLKNPDDRRMMVTAWNPSNVDKAVLPPCHYGFQVWTRVLSPLERWSYCKGEIDVDDPLLHEKLDALYVPKRGISLLWNQRSVDTFLGLPFNIASYGLLLSIIAKLVNMVPEELTGNLGDTHLYMNHLDQAREQMTREPYDLCNLVISEHANELFKKFRGEDGNVHDYGYFKELSSVLNSLKVSDFTIEKYISHEKLRGELSN
jgi:thymidylate synthase